MVRIFNLGGLLSRSRREEGRIDAGDRSRDSNLIADMGLHRFLCLAADVSFRVAGPRSALIRRTPVLVAFRDAGFVTQLSLTIVLVGIAVVFTVSDSVFISSHRFDLMAEMMREELWAFMFRVVSAVGILGMFTRSLKLRLISALLIATAHGVFALCLLLESALDGASIIYVITAMQGYGLVFWRCHEGVLAHRSVDPFCSDRRSHD